MRSTVFTVASLALGLVCGSANADLVLLLDATNTRDTDYIIHDNEEHDDNPDVGIISVSIDDGNLTAIVTILSRDMQRNNSNPVLVLGVLHALVKASEGALTISASETGYDSTNDQSLATLTGTHQGGGGLLGVNYFGDSGGLQFGFSFDIASAGPHNNEDFSWRENGTAEPVGSLTISSIVGSSEDEDSTASYIASLELSTESSGSVAELTGFEIITGTVLDGDLTDLVTSDDSYLTTRSAFGSAFTNLHNMTMRVTGEVAVDSPSTIDLLFESSIDEPAGQANISLKNFNTTDYDLVGSFTLGKTDTVEVITGLDASKYYNPNNGRVRVEIQHVVFVPFLAFDFESYLDQVEITIE